MNKENNIKDIRRLLSKILTNYTEFFDKNGTLNSEGRKILEETIRLILNTNPEYRNIIYRVRRKPTLENIIKIAVKYIPEDDILSVFSYCFIAYGFGAYILNQLNQSLLSVFSYCFT